MGKARPGGIGAGRRMVLLGILFAGTVLGAAVGTTLTLVRAHSGPITPGVVHGCVNNKLGTLRFIGATDSCASIETALDWSKGVATNCTSTQALASLNPDGTAGCQSVITGVAAGTGLSGGGSAGAVTVAADTTYLQKRVSSDCPTGSSIRAIDGNGGVTCQNSAAYSAGTGLNLSGSQFSLATGYQLPQSCTGGQVAKWDPTGAAWQCAADNDHTYGAGEGLGLQGNKFFITPQSRLPPSCSAGQVPKWDSNVDIWTCGNDQGGTTYSAGSGLTLSGTTFSADTTVLQSRVTQACAEGNAIRAISAAGGVTCQALPSMPSVPSVSVERKYTYGWIPAGDQYHVVSIACPVGAKVTGGGGQVSAPQVAASRTHMLASFPGADDTWSVVWENTDQTPGTADQVTVYATCLSVQ